MIWEVSACKDWPPTSLALSRECVNSSPTIREKTLGAWFVQSGVQLQVGPHGLGKD